MRTSVLPPTGLNTYGPPIAGARTTSARAAGPSNKASATERRAVRRLANLSAQVRAGEYHPDSLELAEEMIADSEFAGRLAGLAA